MDNENLKKVEYIKDVFRNLKKITFQKKFFCGMIVMFMIY